MFSQFVQISDMSWAPINEAQAAFEAWLVGQGYELAVEVCPFESAEGGYQGAIDAWDLIDDFLGGHEQFDKDRESLESHACEIGEISNLWNGGPDDEPDDFDDEPPEIDDEPG